MDVLVVIWGLTVMVGVLWYMYHVLEGMFEREEPAMPGMMSLVGVFVVAELGVAQALNLLVEALRGRSSVLLDLEIARVQNAGLFPLFLLVGLVWFLWQEKHLHRRLYPVLLLGAGLTVMVALR